MSQPNALSGVFVDILRCTQVEEELLLVTRAQQILSSLPKNKHLEILQKLNSTDDHVKNTHRESESIASFCQVDLDSFILYVFVRRYGWSDGVKICSNKTKIVITNEDTRHISKINKDRLDKRLDEIINWLSEQRLCVQLMNSYSKLVCEASANLPIVRNRSVVHVLSWLQNSADLINEEEIFTAVCEFVLVTLTDVWSVVRKMSGSHLGGIMDCLTSENQEKIWNKLAEVCGNPKNSWQSIDGAILGTCAIVQHLSNNGSVSVLKKVGAVPYYVRRDLVQIVFSVISHSQLPIRESAVKATAAYIAIIDKQDAQVILEKTFTLLGESDSSRELTADGYRDAYMTEGLLNICLSVVKVLPLSCLLPRWEEYMSAFLHHLSHPASSVRQSASSVFKLLARKSSENVPFFCQMLQTLTKNWTPILSESKRKEEKQLSWQGREGRLFAFEVICCFLIKNHIRTMFSIRARNSKSTEVIPPHCDLSNMQEVNDTCVTAERIQKKEALPSLSVISQMTERDKLWPQSERVCQQGKLTEDCRQLGDHRDVMSCHALWTCVLYQTAECLADSRWELRRMAGQVMPLLGEVVRWFDCRLLEDVWMRHLTVSTSVSTYLSMFLLKESLHHCIRMEPLLRDSEETLMRVELRESVRNILDCMTRNTAKYLPVVELLLQRPCFDRISVLCAEVVILAHRLFDIDNVQKQSQSSTLLMFWRNLFVYAHPGSRISRDLLTPPISDFSSPYDGYLSCCVVRPDGDNQCAKQVERLFLKTVCNHLQFYLSCLPWTDVVAYLPLVMHNVGLFIDDSKICRALIRCISGQTSRIVHKGLPDDWPGRQYGLRCIYFSLREAASIVGMKSLDVQLLQKVLSVYLCLGQVIHPSRHLKVICRGICVRLSKTSHRLDSMDLSPRPDSDSALLLWHDSPMPLCMMDAEISEAEQEDVFEGGDLPSFYSECLSLSNNSSHMTLSGRQRTISCQSDHVDHVTDSERSEEPSEEDSDDWDSWSDEDQDGGIVTEMFSTFLRNLKQSLGEDAELIFSSEMKCLDEDEQTLILNLASTTLS